MNIAQPITEQPTSPFKIVLPANGTAIITISDIPCWEVWMRFKQPDGSYSDWQQWRTGSGPAELEIGPFEQSAAEWVVRTCDPEPQAQ